MIISEEQVREALRYLHTTGGPTDGDGDSADAVPVELLDRISERLRGVPEMREERVSAARSALMAGGPSAEEVAAKIIGRAISDSIR